MRRTILQMLGVVFALGLLVGAVSVYAQSKTERDLLDRINRLEAAKATTDREREALEEKVLQAKRTATANRVVATKKVDAVVGAAIVESTAVTAEQSVIVSQAAIDAKAASEKAAEQADRIAGFANSQFVLQLFILLTAVAGYVHLFLKNRAETREIIRKEDKIEMWRRDAEAKLERVHILVNSNVTGLKERELRGLKANMVLLQLLTKSIDKATVDAALVGIKQVQGEIDLLEADLVQRAKETKDAADKVKADLAKIPGAVPA